MDLSTTVLRPWAKPCASLTVLFDHLYLELEKIDPKQKARKPLDEALYRLTLLAVVAAIARVALPHFPDPEGLPVCFTDRKVRLVGLSPTHLRKIRDGLEKLGYISVKRGFNDKSGAGKDRVTRLVPSDLFRSACVDAALRLAEVIGQPEQVIILPGADYSRIPDDVRESGEIIKALNELNSSVTLSLPADAARRTHLRLAHIRVKDTATGLWVRGYDDAFIYLRRIFKDSWEEGGRLYGGFWMHIPREERTHLLINRQRTVELDYSSQHPTILFAAVGRQLDFDPYTIPGWEHLPREAGKRAFMRTINQDLGPDLRLIDRRGEDMQDFSSLKEFQNFQRAMRTYLSPISQFIGVDNSLWLQRRDSDIAIGVIRRCVDGGINVYPIHDGFIVLPEHQESVRTFMHDQFLMTTGFQCAISVK